MAKPRGPEVARLPRSVLTTSLAVGAALAVAVFAATAVGGGSSAEETLRNLVAIVLAVCVWFAAIRTVLRLSGRRRNKRGGG